MYFCNLVYHILLMCLVIFSGTERFKKIARTSTHSVLAACGMEHSKSVAVTFPKLICKHVGHMQSSCTECLSSFVKNVVSSLLEKKTQN